MRRLSIIPTFTAGRLAAASSSNSFEMGWTYLFVAGLFEIAWAVGLKFTEGFTRWWPSLGVAAGMIISFFFLSLALRTIPVGTGYAVWTGIGAAGTALLGMILFNEPKDPARVACILLIVLGIAGLKLLYREN
jgi:quaternary ammonium compound-resistance protein SugE